MEVDMCGIGGIYVKNPAARYNPEAFVDAMLLGIEPRGQDATGLVAFTDDWQPFLDKDALPARQFLALREELPRHTRAVLCHTRYATQGSQKRAENNHPVQFGDIYVTHNGHIWNDAETFRTLGKVRTAEVDSIAIPAALSARCWQTEPAEALETLEGDFAIAAANIARPGEIILARGAASPLYVHETANFVAWASTAEALQAAWRYGIGTAPSKPRWIAEGTLIRLTPDGATYSRFNPRDRWTKYQTYSGMHWDLDEDYNEPKLLSKPSGTVTVIYRPCELCGDLVRPDELYKVEGLSICPTCEAHVIGYSQTRDVCEMCGMSPRRGMEDTGVRDNYGRWYCDPCLDLIIYEDTALEGVLVD